jgi:hypothetical protein
MDDVLEMSQPMHVSGNDGVSVVRKSQCWPAVEFSNAILQLRRVFNEKNNLPSNGHFPSTF